MRQIKNLQKTDNKITKIKFLNFLENKILLLLKTLKTKDIKK